MAPRAHSGHVPGEAGPWLVALYRDHYRDLVRLATLLLRDQTAAEDAVQDAFVAVARRGGAAGLHDPASMPAYLRSAVCNNARSVQRHLAVRRRNLARIAPPDPAGAADGPGIEHDERARVLAALDSLSDRQREVLVLRYYAECTEAEIADTLGISPGSVKTHAHRGLAALATALGEDR